MKRSNQRQTTPDNSSEEPKQFDSIFNQDINEKRMVEREFVSPLTKCHTYIDMDDVKLGPDDWDIANWPSKWKRRELLNRGIYNGKWADQELKRNQDDWHLCRCIACQLGFSGLLKTRLWNIFKSLDMRTFKKFESEPTPHYYVRKKLAGSGQYSIKSLSSVGFRKKYLVAFCIAALLYNQTKSDDLPKFYPGKETEERVRYGAGCRLASSLIEEDMNDCHELLSQFSKKLRFTEEDIRSCMEKLRSECPRLRSN